MVRRLIWTLGIVLLSSQVRADLDGCESAFPNASLGAMCPRSWSVPVSPRLVCFKR
jgi:hypothetical protein